MSFWGKFGDLPIAEAARLSLLDIAQHTNPQYLSKIDSPLNTKEEQYDLIRLVRMIEGLQMILWRNGEREPITWLPQFFDKANYNNYGAK